jgi:hypothetical protein
MKERRMSGRKVLLLSHPIRKHGWVLASTMISIILWHQILVQQHRISVFVVALLGNSAVDFFPQQNINKILEEHLEVVFSVLSTSELYNENHLEKLTARFRSGEGGIWW